jgi:hypothetical protein
VTFTTMTLVIIIAALYPKMTLGHAGCWVSMKNITEMDMDGLIRWSSLTSDNEEHLEKRFLGILTKKLNIIKTGKPAHLYPTFKVCRRT